MKIGSYILKVVAQKPLHRNALLDKVAAELNKPRAVIEHILQRMFNFKQVVSLKGVIHINPKAPPPAPKPVDREKTCGNCNNPSGKADFCASCSRALFPEYYAEPGDPDFDPMYDFREER